MSPEIPALLTEAWTALGEAGVDRAVIGGCARNAYAEVRATRDVDFVVAADEAGYRAVVAALARRGFRRGNVASSASPTRA